jgi:hypothetical protein
VLYIPTWTLETNTSLDPNFFWICTLVDHVIRNNFSFESGLIPSTLYRNWKTSNLTLDLEIQQHLGSLKQVINVIIWIRDTGVTAPPKTKSHPEISKEKRFKRDSEQSHVSLLR